MSDSRPSAEQLIVALGLEPNHTCGYARLSYTSDAILAADALPAPLDGHRPAGSALYFLVTGSAPVRLHRIRNDQLYHYYLGDPLDLLLLFEDGSSQQVRIGPDVLNGERLQLLIPGGTFHTARVDGDWFLGASTQWPGVLPADVEIGDPNRLAERYPEAADRIRAGID